MVAYSGLARLLQPRSLAFIGGREAGMAIRQSRNLGFAGDYYAVNPKRDALEGVACVARTRDLPAAPDVAFIAISPEDSITAVKDLAAMGAGAAVCYAAGFAETGTAGQARQRRLVEAAGTMPLIGPNCYGCVDYLNGVALWPDVQGAGRVASGVAVILQSGNMALNVTMQDRSLPLARLFSVGNQAHTGMAALIRALAHDPRISAIGLHIESIGARDDFADACRVAAEQRTPIVALSTGNSSAGARLTLSHTSSMAGSHAAMGALFDKLGVARVETLPQLLESLKFLSFHPGLSGRRFVSMSCSGGEAALVADLAEPAALTPPPFTPERQQALEGILGPKVTVDNPLDYHTYIWGDEGALRACFSAALQADVDVGLLILDYAKPGSGDDAAWACAENAIIDAARATARPTMVISNLPETFPLRARQRFCEAGLAPMLGIAEALVAIRVACDIAAAWQRGIPTLHQAHEHADSDSDTDSDTDSDAAAVTLDEWESKRLLQGAGMTVPAGAMVGDAAAAVAAADRIGYPVVLKAVSPTLAHKTEAGALCLDLADGDAVRRACDRLLPLADRLLVESMLQDHVCEMILGITFDPQAGPMLMLGAGGILAELWGDRVLIPLPAAEREIADALTRLKISRLLNGYRGRPAGDVAAVIAAAQALDAFYRSHADRLRELDINPLLVRPAGRGAVVADALIGMIPRHGAA